MTKQELGTKRFCAHCGLKFYDLHHSPITCPKCDTVFEAVSSRFGSEPARAPVPEAKLEMPHTDDAQFISMGDGKGVEGEKDEDVDLNGAALIDETEVDEAEVTLIEDDADDEYSE
jgi:uncharacterized protein (TIGR02300 family)